jgi:hypothetical protein
VITGYNTDVEFDGVTYHVQTEDKGMQTPIILSLVYVGGAILASKRSPYNDLIASGFDKQVLTERLQRQHKLICAAVHAGRIAELKRMGERDAVAAGNVPPPATAAEPAPANGGSARRAVAQDNSEPFSVRLLDEPELRGGTSVVLNVLVTRLVDNARSPSAHTKVVVKMLGTAFLPESTETSTDAEGRATVSLSLPAFRKGRAAILVQAHDDGAIAELRRIVQPGSNAPD